MQLPSELSRAIEEIAAEFPRGELTRAAAELSGTYRGQRKDRPQLERIHRAAYLITRLPATYAVLARILQECRLRIPPPHIESMLDLGAGPGTAMWAAAAEFPELARIVMVEDSAEWIDIGKRLAGQSHHPAIRSAEWKEGSVESDVPKAKFDLVSASYLLNELNDADRLQVIRAAWERTAKLLVIVEPGTPRGFEHVLKVRSELIKTGAHVVAPCPHENICPMQGRDWCHFAERLQRMSAHRLVKSAELGYEDEKYSYVAFAREEVALPAARILRHPRKHSGHVELELCTPDGLQDETVSRKQKEKYKLARKAEWGDAL